METPEPAREQEGRPDHGSSSRGGRAPLARPSVEPEWPGTGASTEARGPSQPALPGVREEAVAVVTVGGRDYTVPPQASLQKALVTARSQDRWRTVSWQFDLQQWWVPSATTAGMVYWLTVRPGTKQGSPWWLRLVCNCDAEQSGRYMACWHKAAVAVWHAHRKVMKWQAEAKRE